MGAGVGGFFVNRIPEVFTLCARAFACFEFVCYVLD